MRSKSDLETVSDDDLLRRLSEILKRVRRDEAELVAHIAEVDARGLYARKAVPSMFAYCTELLHLAENEAYFRITAARASREHPVLLEMLRDGRINLSAIALLARHLTAENCDDLVERAAGKSYRQLKELVAAVSTKPDVRTTIRKLPARRAVGRCPGGSQLGTFRVESVSITPGSPGPPVRADASPSGDASSLHDAPNPGPAPPPTATACAAPPRRSASVEPLAPARYKVEFTADEEMRDMLERLQALMRHSESGGDLAAVLKVAVREKLERLEAKRFAKTKKPRKRLAETDIRAKSRHIPAAVRRTVHQRDGGRCTFRDKRGRRCSKRHDLEFHHREPYGFGGDHSPENLTLMCGTHNALMAEQDYGKEVMWRHRRSSGQATNPLASPSGPAPASSSASRGQSPPLPVSRRRGHG